MSDQWKTVPVEPQPEYIESSGRWKWPLPEHTHFPGACTSVVTASREWWEYAPSEAKPNPMAEAICARDGRWFWLFPAAPPAEDDELARLEREIALSASIIFIKTNSYEQVDGWLELDGPLDSHPAMVDEPEIRYLELRGLLERHPDDPNLVRIKESE